jgi:hypothetical protein
MTTTPEADLAQAIGITTDAMKAMRHHPNITEGLHWFRKKKAAHWTDAGIEVITDVLSLEKNCAPPAVIHELVPLVVVRLVPNPRIIFCRKKNAAEESPLLRLRVRSSENFMPGMEVRSCRPVPGSPDLFDMEGNCPRWKGRW